MEILWEILRASLVAAHLFTGALAGAGPLVAAGCRLFPAMRSEGDDSLRRLAKWSLVAMFASLGVGAVSALLLWWPENSSYRAAALGIPAADYAMLAAEWVFTLVLLTIYFAVWRRGKSHPWLHGLIALVASTNLLYHFPTMMIVMGALAADPGLAAEAEVTRPVFLRLIAMPALLAKTLHFWSLSVLVAGISTSYAGGKAPVGRAASVVQAGGVVGLVGLALMFLTGVLLLTQLPALPQRALIGGDLVATAALTATLGMALAMAQGLLSLATSAAPAKEASTTRNVLLMTAATTLLMAYASGRLTMLTN